MNYPKPTALKLLEGNLGKRPLNEDEPKPKRVIPSKPSHLDGKARKYWKKFAPMVFDLGLLTEQDGPSFGEICQMYSEIQVLTKEIEQEGRIFIKVSVDGAGIEHQEAKSNPKVGMLRDLRKEFRYVMVCVKLPPDKKAILSFFIELFVSLVTNSYSCHVHAPVVPIN